MFTLKNEYKTRHFAWLFSLMNLFLFHLPFFNFVIHNVDYWKLNGIVIIISLLILMLTVNFFVFNILLSISRRVGKFLLILFFMLNAVALYFVNTYSIIVDESMMGNLFNTNYEESSSFFSMKLLVYLFLLGVLPSLLIYKIKLTRSTRKSFLISSSDFTKIFVILYISK